MYRRARALLLTVVTALVPSFAAAQVFIQSPAAPLVSAANESWFRAGAPIQLGEAFYYPQGAPQPFDGFTMALVGAYRGIPLYTATMGVPNSVLFVPIGDARMQPYLRVLDTASRVPYPANNSGLTLTVGGFVAQAPIPPLVARPVEVAPPVAPVAVVGSIGTTSMGLIGATAIAGAMTGAMPSGAPSSEPASSEPPSTEPIGTSGRSMPSRPVTTAVPPEGIDNAWITYDGRRWVADGKAVETTPDMQPVGEYRGFVVYARGSDRSTIYVPSTVDLVVPFRPR
jgi:hypothetical protein